VSGCGLNRRFIKQALLFAVLYYVAVLALEGIIFGLSHIPPKAINLYMLILRLGDVEKILAWPRVLLRKLWPGESTPAILNHLLSVLNCLLWGLGLAGTKALWTHARK
jgi:hypothetical protein